MKDLVIIGAGPGGFDTALHAKELGLDVTLIEKHKVGGTCLNYGCIPTKALYHNAKHIKDLKSIDEFGINIDQVSIDNDVIKTRKESIVSNQINNIRTSLKKAGVELIEGVGNIVSPNIVSVNGIEIETKNIVIATGSVPSKIQFDGDDFDIVHTSKDILSLEEWPKEMTIVGAGVIGCEMAGIFNQLGSNVTVIEYMDEILPPLDKDIKKRARNLYKRQGITMYTKAAFKKVIKKEDGYLAVFEQKGKEILIPTDYVLLSTGRIPNFGGIDLAQLGIDYTKKGILVNEHKQTSIPNIYAIGDVNGELMLAHKATYDGIKVVHHILNHEANIHFEEVPSVVFTFPEIATVGKTEDQMTGDYRTNKYLFKTNAKAECLNETDGFVKLIVDDNDRLVGAHIIGAHASDLIHEATSLIYNKMNINECKNIIHAHPTISEALSECIKKF
jgi:dihydrolipoamide dehydrogenase